MVEFPRQSVESSKRKTTVHTWNRRLRAGTVSVTADISSKTAMNRVSVIQCMAYSKQTSDQE